MPNIHGVISIYDRTKKGDFIDGFPTLLLKHKFYYSSGYQLNPIMEYIHKLGGKGKMYSYENNFNQSTGELETIRVKRMDFSRYLIVIHLSGYHLNNNMEINSTIIKRYLREDRYIDFLRFLYILENESKRFHNGNFWEQSIGYAPVYEIPYYRGFRSFDSDD